jgi:hypothetical protein
MLGHRFAEMTARFQLWCEPVQDFLVSSAALLFLCFPILIHLKVIYLPVDRKEPGKEKVASKVFRSQEASKVEEKPCRTGSAWEEVMETILWGMCARGRTKSSWSNEDPCKVPAIAKTKQKWWGPARTQQARGLAHATELTTILDCRAIQHGDLSRLNDRPWHADMSRALYKDMGMRDTSRVYVAAWLNFNKVSMLAVSQVVHEDLLQECMTKDTLMNRLKFVLRPVHAHVPFPAKGAPEADTIGTFFGLENSSSAFHRTDDGIQYFCVQLDLYSKWQLRLAMKTVGFRESNVMDLLIVDWPGQAILTSLRVTVTHELLQMLDESS